MRPIEEVVHDSERTRVVRIQPGDGSASVIHKEPLGPDAAERLRNEMAMLHRLDGVDGIPRLVPGAPDGMLAYLDAPVRPLASLPSPWDAGPILGLAYRLATTLAAIHRRGVVHRDVSPANILVPLVDGRPAPERQPTLIDFELSTSMAEDRFAPALEAGLAGTLPYLAPEQTGRTGRPVDHRTDLYALGATLYELETGQPPFGRDADPLRLVHDHLARTPVPPVAVNPAIPPLLSDITMRLLEKEPEQRYQSGEGLAYDLGRLRDGAGGFPLGERDFPMRLAPPSRLIGRDQPLATLTALFAEAVTGNRGVALVTGPPGVGKTALIGRLRPAVAAAGGRFVSGKFDQYRRDLGADAVGQAFTALGAQLLAEPEEEVARLRARLLDVLGATAGLAAALFPPFAALLGVPPDEEADDPRTAGARIRQMGLGLLRTIASGAHPVVFFLDDLQWAAPTAFGFLDAVLDEPDLPGVLVLGAFREAEVDEAHPLTPILNRLRHVGGEVRLDNLPPGDLGKLLAEMLRLPGPEAAPLAELLAARTAGNPFDTVELVNALRREGALVPDGEGWQWDPGTLRRFVGRGDVVDLLGTRIEELPAATRELLEVMACLGGEVEIELLRLASGRPADAVGLGLLSAAEDGLVVVTREGTPAVSFRHDRVQQAAYGRLSAPGRARLGLEVARRLATEPQYAAAAAQQYLPALDALTDPAERHTVAGLLRGAATAARMVSNHVAAETFLAAALGLLDPADDGYRAVQAEWHAALCGLGRFAEADVVFEALEAAGQDAVRHAGAVCEQIVGYTNRGMHGVRLGHEAHDGLLRGGDPQNAANTYYATLPLLLDRGPGLDVLGAEVDAALALCDRIGYHHSSEVFVAYRQLRRALLGETAGPGELTDETFDERAHLTAVSANPTAQVNFHIARALAAAVFGDDTALARHAEAAAQMLPVITATYGNAPAHTLAVLGAAERARAASGAERSAALADLRASRDFLAARAADQPGNFRHLLRLATAEEAALAGDFAGAAAAYDAAVSDVSVARRPWHAGLICERAARFFLANGMEHTGERLLSDAFRAYARWGATGKTRLMERDHAFLTAAPVRAAQPGALTTSSSVNVSTEVIDLLAVLAAARALSSETDLDRLRLRVEQVLSAMTGATEVRVVLWDEAGGWVLPADTVSGRPALRAAEAAAAGLLPLTALRYAERTREPMLVDDASRDDRVARDPYLAGLGHCSLLVVPVLSQGVPKAMLILENRLTRRAFTTGRLDSVLLIAGQLTVSIENALVYASLERKVAERTEELAQANCRLEQLTLTDPLTGLANRRRLTDVLEAEWLRALRSGEPIGLAMIDIDNFKKYNDHYGHQGGDECLRLVARTLAGSVRGIDLVARYGGEEFSIIMPGTGAASAHQVAERARQAVADLREPHELVDGGIVTISAGVTAIAPVTGVPPDSLIKVADEALYEAKRDGRNRVAGG